MSTVYHFLEGLKQFWSDRTSTKSGRVGDLCKGVSSSRLTRNDWASYLKYGKSRGNLGAGCGATVLLVLLVLLRCRTMPATCWRWTWKRRTWLRTEVEVAVPTMSSHDSTGGWQRSVWRPGDQICNSGLETQLWASNLGCKTHSKSQKPIVVRVSHCSRPTLR